MTAGAARAEDDEDDDKTFEEKIIEGIMAGIGGTNMENRGIDYRERSPLVVPPKLDLPPPESAREKSRPRTGRKIRTRRAARLRSRPARKTTRIRWKPSRLLTPSELNAAKTAPAARADNDPVQPGDLATTRSSARRSSATPAACPACSAATKPRSAPFKGEPTRESLTQPPTGYQTPSPNFAYGTGPKESLNKEYNPMTGKYRRLAAARSLVTAYRASSLRRYDWASLSAEPFASGVNCCNHRSGKALRRILARQVMMSSHRFAARVSLPCCSALPLSARTGAGAQTTVTSEPPATLHARQRPAGRGDPGSPHARSSRR